MNVEESKVGNGNFKQPSTLQNTIDKKQLENVKYFNNLGSMLTNDARCTRKIKFRIVIAAFNKKDLFTNKLDLNLSKKLAKSYISRIAL
jgi:hypothetical protein